MKKLILLGLLITNITIAFSQIPNYIPKDSIIGWWPFNGNANDESGNGNHGTVNGATTTTDRFGNAKSAYKFDGVNDNILVQMDSNLAPRGKQNYTYSLWFQGTPGSGVIMQIFTGTSGTNISNYDLAFDSKSKVNFNHYPFINNTLSPDTTARYAWTNILVDVNQVTDTVKFYKNGIYWYKGQISNLEPSSGLLSIGALINNLGAFEGKIDELCIWNRALDSNEIMSIYLGCKPANHKKLSTSDTLSACNYLNLTSKNKKYTSYKWSTGDTTLSSTITKSGLVTLTETDSLGCKNIDSVFVRLLKDELPKASDTIFYNVSLGDTLKLNVSSWFNNSKFNYYNYQKIAITEIQLIHKGADSIKWQGYTALKSNNTLKCLIEAKVFPKVLPEYLPKDSLVGWWPFNGSANDESGNGNHGTVLNGVSKCSDKNKKSNSAFEIDGIDALNKGIELPCKLNSNKDFTICIWFKLNDSLKTNTTSAQVIFSSNPHTQLAVGFGHPYYPFKMGSCIGNGSQWLQCNTNGIEWSLTNKLDWHNLVVIKSATYYKYYVDAKLCYFHPINSSYNTNSSFDLILGAINVPTGELLNGKIDDVAIWNRALDSNEIEDIYFENCKPKNHISLSSTDTISSCTSIKLTSKNKSYAKYRWSTGDSSISTVVSKSGLITLRETDSKGCVNIDTVYVRILKDEISQASDTFLCNVRTQDTLKLNLSHWFKNANVSYFDQSRKPVNSANYFVKANFNTTWNGFASPISSTSLKCPIKGNINASVLYPRLVSKTTDTMLTSSSSIKPAISDAKYTKYRWSTGDTIKNISIQNSGNYWFAHYWNATINGVGRYCYQLDSFHLSRINLITPTRITAKLGSKIVIKVKDSLNSNSSVTWSNGTSGWSTVYSVTKNTDTLYATQSDAYRSITKFIVITGRLEPNRQDQYENEIINYQNDGTEIRDNSVNAQNINSEKLLGSDSLNSSSIRIFPNPVSDVLIIEGIDCENSNSNQLNNCHYEIFNSAGQLVQKGNISRTISVANLITGSYTLKIGNSSYKFIKK